MFTALVQQRVISGRCLQPVAVLHADHRRDRACLGQLLRADPGYAQMADQPGGTQRSERGENVQRSTRLQRCAGSAG
jgi:hypothetical protein